MTSSQWVVVAVAGLLAAGTVGVLFTLPIWRGDRRGGLVSALLTAHTGLIAVLGFAAVGAAVRSWQLVDDPTQPVPRTLIEVSRIDGDRRLFALIVLLLALGTVLAVVALAMAARFAAGDDATERYIACGVLGLEICVGGYGVARCFIGSPSATAVVLTAHLPIAMLAMVRCWPPAEDLA
jgi:hypothetical protein